MTSFVSSSPGSACSCQQYKGDGPVELPLSPPASQYSWTALSPDPSAFCTLGPGWGMEMEQTGSAEEAWTGSADLVAAAGEGAPV